MFSYGTKVPNFVDFTGFFPLTTKIAFFRYVFKDLEKKRDFLCLSREIDKIRVHEKIYGTRGSKYGTRAGNIVLYQPVKLTKFGSETKKYGTRGSKYGTRAGNIVLYQPVKLTKFGSAAKKYGTKIKKYGTRSVTSSANGSKVRGFPRKMTKFPVRERKIRYGAL